MPLALLMESFSVWVPCSVSTSRGMICTLAGKSASLVPVLPSDGACCSGGPELLLLGPLPSSTTLAVGVAGFGDWFACETRRFAAAAAADACFGFGADRFCGASPGTGGSVVGFSCALAGTGTAAHPHAPKTPA